MSIAPDKGEVSSGTDVVRLEPKVMQVLIFLVEYHGQVKSQQQIFEAVWSNSIFSPNLVQRSIGHIRNAFKALGCQKQIIKTFPKKGYCLESDLLVHPHHSNLDLKSRMANLTFDPKLVVFFLVIVFSGFIFIWNQLSLYPNYTITKVHSLTATKYTESSPIYLDSEKVVYIESNPGEANRIRVFDQKTQQSTIIFQSIHSIVAIAKIPEKKSILAVEHTKEGFDLSILDISTFDEIKQQYLYTRRHFIAMQSLKFVDEQTFAYIGLTDGRSAIYHESIADQTYQNRILLDPGLEPFAIDVMPSQNSLAILAFDSQKNAQQLVIFNLDSSRLKSVSSFAADFYQLVWSKNEKGWFLGNGHQLIFQPMDGTKHTVTSGSLHRLNDINLHPLERKFIGSTFQRDANLWRLEINNDFQDLRQSETNYRRVSQSTSLDYAAAIHPENDAIVYISDRSGKPQMILSNRSSERVIYKNTQEHNIVSKPVWSHTKNLIAFTVNGLISVINVDDGRTTQYQPEWFIDSVIGWYQDNSNILCTAIIDGNPWLIKYDTNSNISQILTKQDSHFVELNKLEQIIQIKQNKLVDLKGEVLANLPDGDIWGITMSGDSVLIQLITSSGNEIWQYHFSTQDLHLQAVLADQNMRLESANGAGNQLVTGNESLSDDVVELRYKEY